MEAAKEQFALMLMGAHTLIGYSPMKKEIDWTDIPGFFSVPHHIVISQDQSIDPFAWGEKISKAVGNNPTVILIPGTAFDAGGGRIGRGGGWYDRFLSKVPRSWIRVGMLHRTEFSETPLVQKPWDQPMDFLFMQEKDGTYAVIDSRKK